MGCAARQRPIGRREPLRSRIIRYTCRVCALGRIDNPPAFVSPARGPSMPFDKVDTQIDFPAQERAILAFWQRTGAFDRLREKNRGKPRWSFLDGPITANNPMGVHHAWGRTYKDAYQRYFAMTGHERRYQNGFDCQGLWVEVGVEKELKIRSKRE